MHARVSIGKLETVRDEIAILSIATISCDDEMADCVPTITSFYMKSFPPFRKRKRKGEAER